MFLFMFTSIDSVKYVCDVPNIYFLINNLLFIN